MKFPHNIRTLLCALLFSFLASVLGNSAFAEVTQPTQPTTGPGSSECISAAFDSKQYGAGNHAYWLFEPRGAAEKKNPIVVFVHGWGAVDPKSYGAWIKHVLCRGYTVIYPVYQENLKVSPSEITANTIQALKYALNELGEGEHLPVDLTKVAAVGHSMGGVVAANLAAMASEQGLPAIRAVMAVEPGKTWSRANRANIQFADLTKIPSETLLISIYGEDDRLVEDVDAKKFFDGATEVPGSNKNLIRVRSDDHGTPPFSSNHFAPAAPDDSIVPREAHGSFRESIRERIKEHMNESGWESAAVGAFDYYVTWKLFDGLCDAVFTGKNRQYALGNTPEQRFTGLWSDRTPVRELVVER